MSTLAELKEQWMANPEFKKAYDAWQQPHGWPPPSDVNATIMTETLEKATVPEDMEE